MKFNYSEEPSPSRFSEIKSYLNLAKKGVFPLFQKDWIALYDSKRNGISLHEAKNNLRSIFNGLRPHRNVDRKKMAINLMENEKRQNFIDSFMRVLESEMLDEKNRFH